MLLLSNYKKCSDTLASRLSNYFVALDAGGTPISALKSFDTTTGIAKTLDGQDLVPASWELRIRQVMKIDAVVRVPNLKWELTTAGYDFADKLVPYDDGTGLTCSFCPPRAVRQAYKELWSSEHRYSLRRSPEEHAIALQLYRAELAMDRIDATLIPYLNRLNTDTSSVSTYMSCDGARRKEGGYVDFRTLLSPEETLRLFATLRYDRSLACSATLGLRPLGFSADSFCALYNLRSGKSGWENFEPLLAAFCAALNL